MLIRPKIINPQLGGPRLFASGFAVKEEDVRFHALRVEDPCGQSEQSVHIAFVEELSADRFACPTLEEYVVRHHNRHAAMNLHE